jgi:hypothetical protein
MWAWSSARSRGSTFSTVGVGSSRNLRRDKLGWSGCVEGNSLRLDGRHASSGLAPGGEGSTWPWGQSRIVGHACYKAVGELYYAGMGHNRPFAVLTELFCTSSREMRGTRGGLFTSAKAGSPETLSGTARHEIHLSFFLFPSFYPSILPHTHRLCSTGIPFLWSGPSSLVSWAKWAVSVRREDERTRRTSAQRCHVAPP